VTVASKRNWDLAKSLGASAVFDYNDPDVVSHILKWTADEGVGPLKEGLDTISENGSIEKCVAILGDGGRLITLLDSPKDLDTKDVDVHRIIIYSALKPKNTEDFKQMAEWNGTILPKFLETGKLSGGVVPLKIFTGGLEDLPEAIDFVRKGKNSGQKVVVTLKSNAESRW